MNSQTPERCQLCFIPAAVVFFFKYCYCFVNFDFMLSDMQKNRIFPKNPVFSTHRFKTDRVPVLSEKNAVSDKNHMKKETKTWKNCSVC